MGARMRICDIIKGLPDNMFLSAFPTEHRTVSCGYSFELERRRKFLPDKAKKLDIPVDKWKILQNEETVKVGDMTVTPDMVLGEQRKGLKFIFTGDTTPCRSLIGAAKDADLMICEATYGDDELKDLAAERGHMVFSQAAQCASEANVKKLWLAHYSQRIIDPAEYLHFASDIFPDTVCGYDGLSTVLEY